MHLLVVDDDPKFRSYVSRGFTQSGCDCSTAADADAALKLLEAQPVGTFDMVLLDIMMPGRSGWDMLEELRARDQTTPVIFVTARDAVDERVKGLQLGADDYIIKPFAFDELRARIGAVIRRRNSLAPLRYADLEIDLASRSVRRGEFQIDLSQREFDLLRVLVSRHGEVLSRATLLQEVWGMRFDPETNVVDMYVGRLRRKLDRRGRPLIRTERGAGYCLVAPGEERPALNDPAI